MGIPVIIVPKGGIPVTEAANGYGIPVTVATNGRGVAVTVVAKGGLAVVGSGLAPLPTPLVLDLFTSTASYSSGSNCTASLDTSAIPGVANCVKFTTTAVGSGQGIAGAKTLGTQYDPTTQFGDTIAFLYEADRYASNQVQFEIGRSSSFSGVTVAANNDDMAQGAKWVAFPKTAFTSMPSGLGNIQLRPRYSTRVPSNAEVKYSAIVANAKGRPTMVPTLDDCHRSAFSLVFPYFTSSIPGGHFTFNVAPDLVGTPNKYSIAECQEMYAAGHDAACDSPNDFSYFFWTDPAGASAQLATIQQWLIDNSMPRGRFYGCYPEGQFMATATDPAASPNKSVRSSTIVAPGGSNSFDVGTLITANPAGTVVEIGMKMYGGFGANKISGATVTNVAGTTITVDQTVNAAVTRAVFIDLSSPFTIPGLPNTFRDTNGIRLFRTTLGGGTSGSAGYLPQFTRFGFAGQAQTFAGQGYTGGVLANMKLDLDKVAAVGGTIMPYFHNIVTGTPSGLDTSYQDVFVPYMEYAKSLGFQFLSMSELWERDNLGYEQLLP